MTDIATPDQLRTRIAGTMAGVAELARQAPGNNWLFSILRQLEYIDGELQAGRSRLDRAGELNFALLASHYVDDVAPALAADLHSIYTATRRLFAMD